MNRQIGATEAVAGTPVTELDTPVLLVDADLLESNITAMKDLMAGKAQRLRPHAKTHKSAIIAQMQRAAGAQGFCCAKLSEAEAVAGNGAIDDIMITTPLTGPRKLHRLAQLARSVNVSVLVDNAATIDGLADAAARAGKTINVLVEVDVGQQRCGTPPGPAAATLAAAIAGHKHLHFRGLHGYHGKVQMTASFDERRAAVATALERLMVSAEHCRRAGHELEILTGGGSGSIAIDLALGGLNEFQPGSYVFMDANYRKIAWNSAGDPPPFKPSLTVLTSAVSRPTADRAIVDVGWKSISVDSGPPVPADSELVFDFAGDEHGAIRRRDGKALGLAIGAKIELIPSHCDTTVNLHDNYTVTRGGVVEGIWPIDGRGSSQ